MGRKRREWIPNYFYHVVCRGNRRDPLFKDDSDFVAFNYILQKVYEKYPFEIASYCLMTNHFHLQIRSKEQPLSKIMSLINKRYANYYNTRYRLTGHVFEKRYYDKVIDSVTGMLEVSRYIHLNPCDAGMVRRPGEYKWSSYRFYIRNGHTSIPHFMNINVLLDYFTGSIEVKRLKYGELVISRDFKK
jgi:putative transposase